MPWLKHGSIGDVESMNFPKSTACFPNHAFPNVSDSNCLVTSPKTRSYNCIAYAADDDKQWWWPDEYFVGYWPPSAPRECTKEAFIIAYESCGYEVCCDGTLEENYEKIVIYIGENGPTHASRQKEDGTWVSKMGESFDISHQTPNVISGGLYGSPEIYMKRKKV